jgi:hypothetical protein
MFNAIILAMHLYHGCACHYKEPPTPAPIRVVEVVEQPDLIKWNLQFFYDAMQRDDRQDMEKFAKKSIELLNLHKKYKEYIRVHEKDTYLKLMNLKKVIPEPPKIDYNESPCHDCAPPQQKRYSPARKYIIPGQQLPRTRDPLPGNNGRYRNRHGR